MTSECSVERDGPEVGPCPAGKKKVLTASNPMARTPHRGSHTFPAVGRTMA